MCPPTKHRVKIKWHKTAMKPWIIHFFASNCFCCLAQLASSCSRHCTRQEHAFGYMCTKEKGVIHYLGVLNEPVGRELAGREQRLAECGMRCGAVAC